LKNLPGQSILLKTVTENIPQNIVIWITQVIATGTLTQLGLKGKLGIVIEQLLKIILGD